MLELISPFVYSLIIGLLIGLERERNVRKREWIGGIRTFILFSLLGAVVAKIDLIYLSIIIPTFIFGLILISYYRANVRVSTEKPGVGITTELAAAIVYALGYLTLSQPKLALIISIIVLVVLFERDTLHKFSREEVTVPELKAAIIILVIGITILPLLPDHPIDPWQLINFQKLGLLIFVIALMQFVGYISLRLFGEKIGYLLIGFFGGLISSTALFADLSKKSRGQKAHYTPMLSAILSSLAATFTVGMFIILIISPLLFKAVAFPIAVMIFVSLFLAFIAAKLNGKNPLHLEELPNPLDLKTVIKLALLIFVLYVAVAFASQFLGIKAASTITFLGGLFQSHSVMLANVLLFVNEKLALNNAVKLVYVAILASFVSKYVMLAMIARNKFAVYGIALMSLVLVSGFFSYFFIVSHQTASFIF